MPIYEYRCDTCPHTFEVLHLSSCSTSTEPCPKCGAENTRRIMSAPSRAAASTERSSHQPLPPCGAGGCPSAGGFS